MIIYLPCRLTLLLLITPFNSSTYEYASVVSVGPMFTKSINSRFIWRYTYTMRTSAKEHKSPNFNECFCAVRWLVYTARKVHIQSSSVLFPPLWTQLRKLHVDLHISSVSGPDSSISCFLPFTPQRCQQRIHFFFCLPMSCNITVGRFILMYRISKIIYETYLSDLVNIFLFCILILKFLQYRLKTPW